LLIKNIILFYFYTHLKIREIYKYDFSDYWISIFNVLCVLCPRPKPSDQENPSSAIPPSKTIIKEIKRQASSKSLKNENNDNSKSDSKVQQNRIQTFEEKFLSASKVPPIFLSEFGKPKYGLSKSSWKLLLITRLNVEDITINMLGFKLDIYPKKPLEDIPIAAIPKKLK